MRNYYKQHVVFALQNLWAFKLRSTLTWLSVMVGAASIVALILSGQLATAHALEQFMVLGSDLLAVNIKQVVNSPNNYSKLQLSDVQKIKNSSSDILEIAPYVNDYERIEWGGKSILVSLIGTTSAFERLMKVAVRQGRFISEWDKAPYLCVVGNNVLEAASGLIGKQIRIGNHFLTVAGLTRSWGESTFIYADINQSVIVPLPTAILLHPDLQIQNILFKLKPGADVLHVQKAVDKAIHTALPKSRLVFRNGKALLESMQKQHQTFTFMLGAIGSISLIMGGIGVMNVMLVSVGERHREIGIRMAVGAKRRDILYMFLIEAIILSLCGGIMGIIVGVIGSWVIAVYSHWSFTVYAFPVVLGFFVSVWMGIFFGYYPAYKASRLHPIETLRAE